MTLQANCEHCGKRGPAQHLWVGNDDGCLMTLCQGCAGDKWVPELVTPTLAGVLDDVEAYLDEHADADYGEVIDGVPEVVGNDAASLLTRLREARGT